MPKLTISEPKPKEKKEENELTRGAEAFQRQADANATLRTYDTASRKIIDLMQKRKTIRESMTRVPARSESWWDYKHALDATDDEWFYWQGEKRDILMEKQIAAMDRLTAALEGRQ